MEGEAVKMMTDVQTVFMCLDLYLLRSDKPIYASRMEIEAVESLSKSPERAPMAIDWDNVKSRLNIASSETDENKAWWKARQK